MDLTDLICHVRHVNSRKEKHGEDEKLAVDVSLRLMMGETGDEWGAVLAAVLGEERVALLPEWAKVCNSIRLSLAVENHKVVFKYAPKSRILAALTSAKVNHFVIACDDLGITFRVQATANGDTVGALAELIGMKVRVNVTAMQIELPLDPPSGNGVLISGEGVV